MEKAFSRKNSTNKKTAFGGLQEKNGDYIFCMMFACFINFPAASAEPSEASDLPELEL